MIKLFLDDVRNPKDCLGYMHLRIGAKNPIYLEDWLVVRNYEEFQNAIEEHFPYISHISFDHDLADEHYDIAMEDGNPDSYDSLYDTFKEKTGVDCAKFLKEYYKNKNEIFPEIFIHSMNPIGSQNIINVLN